MIPKYRDSGPRVFDNCGSSVSWIDPKTRIELILDVPFTPTNTVVTEHVSFVMPSRDSVVLLGCSWTAKAIKLASM